MDINIYATIYAIVVIVFGTALYYYQERFIELLRGRISETSFYTVVTNYDMLVMILTLGWPIWIEVWLFQSFSNKK